VKPSTTQPVITAVDHRGDTAGQPLRAPVPAERQRQPLRAPVPAERQLAWKLADAMSGCLADGDHPNVYAALGAGNTFHAIRHLLTIAVRETHPVPCALVHALAVWLEGYAGGEYYTPTRQLLDTVHRQTLVHGSGSESRR
jgi:hypothetical protein